MNQGGFGGGGSWRPPLFTLGKFPIHVTGLILLLQIVGMLITVVSAGKIVDWTAFSADSFLGGQVWAAVTYAFFELPSISFVIGAYFFFLFGSAVESSMSRKDYVTLGLGVLLLPPLVSLACHFSGMKSFGIIGSNIPHLSIFMAFCAMNPNVPSFFGIKIKWFGLAFFGITVLQLLTGRAWSLLIAYALAVGFAIWFVRRLGFREGFSLGEELLGPGRGGIPRVSRGKKKKKVRRAKETKPKLRPKSSLSKADDSEVDRILDKINKDGLHSLTDEERELLQRKSGK